MSSVEHLLRVSAPFFTIVANPKDVATEALGWQDSALAVRAIRGGKTRTLDGFFNEFAAAFQFPYYFGENWSAFRDCVSDLDWLPYKPGVVVLVYGASEVLAESDHADMVTLVQALETAAGEFAEAVSEGAWWDRGPVPFHVVLQGMGIGDFERWLSAGATPRPLTQR
ncbi:barstar family protein [Nocardioides sp. WV_118_6]